MITGISRLTAFSRRTNFVFEIHKFYLYNINVVCCCVVALFAKLYLPSDVQPCHTHVPPGVVYHLGFHVIEIGRALVRA